MLLSALILILSKIIEVFVFILPEWDLPDKFINAINYFLASAKSVNFIFPIYDLLGIVLILISFEVLLYTSHLISKLIFKDRLDL